MRPAEVRSALRRRWFERLVARSSLIATTGLLEIGSDYGGWTLPAEQIQASWTCYLVGAGKDISLDLELIERYGVTVRCFDPVAEYVEKARAEARGESRFSVRQAALALADGPIQMQLTHDPLSRSVSAAHLYDDDRFVQLPGRTLASLMAELGDTHIDLLKIDIEGSEYGVLPTLPLAALGVKVLAVQLHHTGSVKDARGLIRWLRQQGYEPVACRQPIRLTFLRRDLL